MAQIAQIYPITVLEAGNPDIGNQQGQLSLILKKIYIQKKNQTKKLKEPKTYPGISQLAVATATSWLVKIFSGAYFLGHESPCATFLL